MRYLVHRRREASCVAAEARRITAPLVLPYSTRRVCMAMLLYPQLSECPTIFALYIFINSPAEVKVVIYMRVITHGGP
jgi:hypothetical protein